MITPEAETYLRCRLEDALIGSLDSGRQELGHRVRAALAIGALTEDAAELLLADADRAFGLRLADVDRDDDDVGDDRPEPPRTVVCPTVIEQDWGTLVITHLVLGEYESTVGVSGVLRAAPTRGPHRHDEPWQAIEVVDAAGTTHHSHFSGGSSDTSFDGGYTVCPGLDPAAAAVTVAGHRIDLADPPVPPAVRVESLHGLSPPERARRHLQLVSGGHGPWNQHEAQVARETFVDLELSDVDERPGAGARPARHRGPRSRRDKTSSRWLAIGATTPPVDGLVLTLTTLTDDGRVSFIGTSHGPVNSEEHWPPIRLGAVDDLGTRYTGQPDQSSSGGRSFQVTERLVPDLAANATVLTIVIDTLCHQVLIDVPLDWQEAR